MNRRRAVSPPPGAPPTSPSTVTIDLTKYERAHGASRRYTEPILSGDRRYNMNEKEDSQTNALSGRPVYAEMTADSRFRESAAVSLPPLSFDRILSRSLAVTGVPVHFFFEGS